MEANNIILAGVGGQGLVLATKIIADAANFSGIDVKTNDVVGLSQRGGKVWGSVKLGKKVFSPNINPGEADLLIAFEKLEARRFRQWLRKENSAAVVNTYEMAPSLVQQEKEEYAESIEEELRKYTDNIIMFNATEKAEEIGNSKAANIIMLGACSRFMEEIPESAWLEAIKENVPEKFLELNKEAFLKARSEKF